MTPPYSRWIAYPAAGLGWLFRGENCGNLYNLYEKHAQVYQNKLGAR